MPSLGSALLLRGRNRKLRLLPRTFAKPPIASLSFAELSARASQHRDHWRRAARSNDVERLEPEPPAEGEARRSRLRFDFGSAGNGYSCNVLWSLEEEPEHAR